MKSTILYCKTYPTKNLYKIYDTQRNNVRFLSSVESVFSYAKRNNYKRLIIKYQGLNIKVQHNFTLY